MIDGNRLDELVRSNIETLCRHFSRPAIKTDANGKLPTCRVPKEIHSE